MKTMILAFGLVAAAGFAVGRDVDNNRDRHVQTGTIAGKTWVLDSAAEMRLSPPPFMADTRQELDQLRSAAPPDAQTLDRIRFWDAGAPSYRWLELLLDRTTANPIGNPQTTRALALLNIAVYDATLAAWDSKYTYLRQRPSDGDHRIATYAPVPASPAYPCERSVAAGAAAAILGYLFPQDAAMYESLARQAADSRVAAAVALPSDVSAGLTLGRKVAERVISRARTDGSDAVFSGTVPQGPGLWNGVNPVSPMHGTWRTWVLASGSQFRPGPPPAYDSEQKKAELEEIVNFARTFNSNAKAFFYQTPDGIFNYWYRFASQKMFEYHIDTNPVRAARMYALMSVSHYDASVSCWDAKYAYWAMRPFQLDSQHVNTLFTTPNHPSYPAAHGCYSGAIAATMGSLFPMDAGFINAKATEAANSRVAAGIHFRSDVEAGLKLGRQVSEAVMEQAARDGSNQ